jgi:3-oxoacyl-[acyl-carrier-protein] synthase II
LQEAVACHLSPTSSLNFHPASRLLQLPPDINIILKRNHKHVNYFSNKMSGEIFITGIGIISAIGKNVGENFDSLIHTRSGIGKIKNIQTRHASYLSVGEVPYSNDELFHLAGVVDSGNHSRTSLLGIIAAKEAFADAGIEDARQFRTGIVSATSVGGMGVAENHFLEYIDPNDKDEFLNYIRLLDCSDSTEKIAAQLGIIEFLSTISTACSSSANSIMYGARLIKNNILDRVIVGGTDSLSRFTINGFNTLKILDSAPCRPFDASRTGLNLGEGSGFVVLESEKASKGKKVYGTLAGFGNANDAYHQTASSPEGEGAFSAMQKAFKVSGLRSENISYINAHGTGTELNDLSEGLAIERLFKNTIPPLSSTKAYTGHTLAAAGAIEAVFSILAIQHQVIYPNLNFKNNIQELHFSPVEKLITDKPVNHVLSNSFGFGGNTSSLIFSKI